MKIQLFFSCSILLLLTNCGDSSDDKADCTEATGALSGTILNRPFGLQDARALYDSDEDEYQIQMFGDDDIDIVDVCDNLGTMLIGSQITFFVDNVEESKDFGGTRIVSLFHAASNEFMTTTNGCYSVDNITSTEVSGALTLRDSDGNDLVSGTWSATICE